MLQKVAIHQALNLLDEELEGKEWLCGSRFSAADCHFYGIVSMLVERVTDAKWVLAPTRRNVKAYFERMEGREASLRAKLDTWADGLEESDVR